ncbi:DUF116 domain-containing protein [Geobacter sp. FeAm09]|uniref:DUF116 domain-containing protein n=1 Tax=Geobacter sp. FeAm09 TaxID=2597769 RepID=UPI0011EFCCC9|nr:DUF116 domain-containing protein [Geobacter sp. FeAm09]QEM69605.1 DUF116 domain-containing protein [Geobacter sp. FeAm09]
MTGTKETATPPRKRLFISLMGFTCLIVVGLIFLAWWVPNRGLANIHPQLPHIVGIVVAVLSGVAILGTGLLVLTTALGKDIFFTRFMRLVVIKFLLPMIELVGRGLGLDKDSIRQSFIAMNNSLVISQRQKVRPDRILVLLPHCIQLFDCEIKVTGDIGKCVQCGRCDIKGLVGIGRKYHVDISVATGGTLARKVIVEKRPKLVLAVACERDLTSGIKDCYPLPVIGILNDRPFGPCFNTTVDTAKIDAALSQVILMEEPASPNA